LAATHRATGSLGSKLIMQPKYKRGISAVSQQRLSRNISKNPHDQDEIFLKYVGSAVKKYRILKELDIEYISINSGIPNNIICDLENGIADIYLNDLISIACALNIDINALVDIPTE
jgi:hypothetical protein